MKSNPGGQLAPEEILGRDEFIAELWEILAGRNVYMNDLRRIGKTMIINKMEAEPPPGWVVLKRDLGGLRTASEFATRVFRDANSLLSIKKRSLRRMTDLIGSVEEIAGVLKLKNGSVAPWKEVLSRTFADLDEDYKTSEERIVFFWDEVPFLLDNIRTDEGPARAMEVLDTLRSLTQDYPSIRLLLTGSVGIHHVLTELRRDGYNNSPLNTFERVAPGPLDRGDAIYLADQLLLGEKLKVPERGDASECIASLTGDVPFYIHRLVSRMPKSKEVTPASLHDKLESELIAADNDWDLAHYRNRLTKYYPNGNDETVVLSILDSLSGEAGGLPVADLMNRVKSTVPKTDDEQIRSLLKLLLADHYLVRNSRNRYTFRLEIVRRWWGGGSRTVILTIRLS
ncbi:MAG: hypothetical protein CMO55_17360 [Verrucomicrobiales bacterium]|nr:hypothetical protein [Verrucomicrobiales bacterium]